MKNKFKKKIKKILENSQIRKKENVYNKIVESDFLKKNDSISANYKKDIYNYWKKYDIKINTNYHKWYSSRNGIEDVRYIPESIFYPHIVPYYNNLKLVDAFADKAYYDVIFPDVNRPKILIKNVNGFNYNHKFNYISYDDIRNIFSENTKVILKPTLDSGTGKGIQVFENINQNSIKDNMKQIFDGNEKNFVIQEFINQHEEISKLNKSSVNTIRIMSFLHQDGVKILGSHIRTGKKDSIYDHYGINYGVDKDGRLYNFGIEYNDGTRLYDDDLPSDITNFHIPNFHKILDIVKNKHLLLSHFRLIAWDFAINYDGEPLLIEYNIRAPGINNHQLIEGPIFGEFTEEILKEVFKS